MVERADLAGLRALLPLEPDELVMAADMAIDDGHRSVVKLLIDEGGLHVDATHYSVSLLARAASEKRRDIVDFLLERGANLQGVPLVHAAKAGDLEIVRRLIEAGADPNAGRRGFPTPLAAARQFRHADIEAFLVEHGATELVGKGAG